MILSTWFIDTFTVTPFKGNPTAVCHTEEELCQHTMLSIANELNCPVTAFIRMNPRETNAYDIRYFTPITEIPACGHATLASAKFVMAQNDTAHSLLFCTINNVSIKIFIEGDKILMTYPAFELEEYAVDDKLLAALYLDRYKTAGYSPDLETLFIELESAESLKKIQPDYQKLINSSDTIKEVVITSVSDNRNFDYYLRSFCPWIGINEDPVTGSVHSVLGNFWKKRLNKKRMNVYQASPRGGELEIRAFDDHVEIGGEAVIILKGEISL